MRGPLCCRERWRDVAKLASILTKEKLWFPTWGLDLVRHRCRQPLADPPTFQQGMCRAMAVRISFASRWTTETRLKLWCQRYVAETFASLKVSTWLRHADKNEECFRAHMVRGGKLSAYLSLIYRFPGDVPELRKLGYSIQSSVSVAAQLERMDGNTLQVKKDFVQNLEDMRS
uniref:Uncharacterized protein n=1 Tax=Physcomitrium patens TaxID=3218 RepID=A0A7I4DHA4_PHYPA